MRAILLGPVPIPAKVRKSLLRSLKIRPEDFLIGVDGGAAAWKKWGFVPHLAVGDWDSLAHSKAVLATLPHITLSKTKDRSDLFFSIIAALEVGAKQITCLGVTGGRPDHHFSNLCDLSNFSAGRYGKLESVQAQGAEGDYHFLSTQIPSWKSSLAVGSTVSIFAVESQATGVTAAGFQYPLKDSVLFPSSQGLSNRTKKRKCEVRLRNGQLLVIIPRNVSY